MSKEEAIEILSEMRSEYNLFGDEEEATRYHVLSWAIKEMNTEPVRHGHWTNISISVTGNSSSECSRCGAVVHDSFSNAINYCPNCGAKMDEVTEYDVDA